MRRSTGMGGGRVIRAVGRAVGAGVGGVKDALSATAGVRPVVAKPARVVSVSSPGAAPSPSSPTFAAAATTASRSSLPCFCDVDEWESVGGEEEEGDVNSGFGFAERFVFGPVPSREEAEEAVSTLQRIFVPIAFSGATENGCSPPLADDVDVVDKVITSADLMERVSLTESESDWIEPALHLYSSNAPHTNERDMVLDAFRLLQINPSIQRMVVSLSSDEAVWDAVMKNEVVQEFKKSLHQAESSEPHSTGEGDDIATGSLRWILHNTKGKIMEFFDKVTKLVSDIFQSQEKDEESEYFGGVLKSSFMLSVVVFIIVVVTRVQRA